MFDIYVPQAVQPYESTIYHSFSNARARKEVLEKGRTHVAVGFVDLSFLLSMDLVQGHGSGPLRFVGFEMSSFSVAKTSVIAAMLRKKDDNNVDAILQVWYSSCWSDSTLQKFNLAVEEAKRSCKNREVLEMLNHWSVTEPPSIMVARQKWLSKIDESIFDPAVNALKSRNTLMFYFLTGQLLSASVGSVAMFELPTKYKSGPSRNESCFHSLDIRQLAFHTRNHNGDFVAGAIALLREQISRLNELLFDGSVSIEIEPPSIVSLDYPEVISKIRALNPYTISWNNCLDYMTVKDFHRLARSCSAPEDTMHYGYSMNWRCDVKGSSSLELPVGEHMTELMQRTLDVMSMTYPHNGLTGLLIDPPIDNPINILDYATVVRVRQYWTDMFFESVSNVGVIESSFYNVFSRSNTNLFLTWTYDDSISFKPLF